MEQNRGAQSDARPLREIIADVVRDIDNIFRNELRLAGIELKTKLHKSAKAGGLLAAAGLLGFFAMACMIGSCIVALAIVLPWWLCFLVMGVMLSIGAGGAFLFGRIALQEVDPLPQRTLETMKDNLEWAKNRVKS